MAEWGQTGEELTCAICVESLRDPVQLPCQHSYCRGCITMFAQKSKPKDIPEPSSDALGDDWVIACPMCRQPTKLWRKGMVVLTVNTTQEGTVEKGMTEVNGGSEVKAEMTGPWCSLCEEEGEKQAVKFCVECDILYCVDCLCLHPMRGKFKDHQLISTQEYIPQGQKESPEKTDEEDVELCTVHKKALILYCDACEQLCCLDCMQDHCGHPMSDKLSAYKKLREPWDKKIEDCRGLKEEMTGFSSQVKQFLNDIKEKEDGKKTEIGKAYKKGLDVLNAWRRGALKLVEKEHLPLSSEAMTSLTDLQANLTEVEQMIQDAGDLPTSLSEIFLKMSRQVTSRMNEQLPKARDYVKNLQGTREKLEKMLKQDPVSSLYLNVDLRAVSVPKMRFTQTSHASLKIEDHGSAVHLKLMYGLPDCCEAWTGSSFQTGRHFWQIEISLDTGKRSNTLPVCTCGVRQEGFSLRNRNGKECWWVEINCNKTFLFLFPKITHTLGFYLDCYSQRLTIIDCKKNTVMLTMDNVDMSKPLVPAVNFHCPNIRAATARLVTGDSVSPASVLWSTL